MFILQNIFVIEDNISHANTIITAINNFKEQKNIQLNIAHLIDFTNLFSTSSKMTITSSSIFFIDIDLGTAITGVDIAKKIRNLNTDCPIIFITNNQSKALEVVNEHILPFNYIVKNADDPSLIKQQITSTLQRIFSMKEQNADEYLIIKQGATQQVIKFSTIVYLQTIKGDRYRTFLKTTTNEYILNIDFANLKKKFFPNYFILNLRSYIINLHEIAFLDRKWGTIQFKNDDIFHVSVKIIDKIKQKQLQ